MEIVEITKDELDSFASGRKHAQFLQSSAWGDFQGTKGLKVHRWGIKDPHGLFYAMQFFENSLPIKMKYLYAPRISIKPLDEKKLALLFDHIRLKTRQTGAAFFRFEPCGRLHFPNHRCRISKTIDVQPSRTLIIDLERSEDGLLKDMHAKTRYNIKLAAKKGVAVSKVGLDRFDEFWALMKDTVKRDGFRLHGREHYRQMIDKCTITNLYFAEYGNKVLAANIVAAYGDMLTYVHGASSNEHRNLMAPYLLQWEVMRQAKALGYTSYDMYGIDEIKWPGVTRFKRGFGGEEISYPGTFDVVSNDFKYKIYQTLRILRKKF